MIKKYAFSIIATLLIFSILAPTVVTFLNTHKEVLIAIDFADEESKKEESKKKFDEKELFFGESINPHCFYETESILNSSIDYFKYSDVSTEIILPPPEQLI